MEQHIFIVDDEPDVLKAIDQTLEDTCCKVSTFTDSFACLEKLSTTKCDLLITDINMPGLDGVGLLKEAKKFLPYLPVLVITGYADIPLAIKAVKAGAIEFLEKPLNKKTFLKAVNLSLLQSSRLHKLTGKKLTMTEEKVLMLVLDAKSNRQIAGALHRSVRTVEVHRNNIMRKLNVDNVVNLIKKATKQGLIDIL